MKSISFEPGILKREGNESRLNTEVGSTLRSQMGDNQTAVISFSAKPGEMIRLSENPHMAKEVSQTLTRSDGKLGDNQPTVVAFAQNTREEVRSLGNLAGACSASTGSHQTTYVMTAGFKGNNSPHARSIGYGKELSQTLGAQMPGLEPTMMNVKCLCPSQPQTHRVYDPTGAMPALMANTGTAGQDQSAILNHSSTTTNTNTENKLMKAEVRRLTPTEVQRLQGFDEGHLDVNDQGDSAKYSESGNSWAVPNARHVNKGIHKVDARLHGGKMRPFKYGTISSGVEAHTQSVAGFGDKAVFFSEIAPAPCGVLQAHYPDVPNFGDMTLIDYDSEKKCIHNRPYEGYSEPAEKEMGFKPFKTETPVEIPCEYGEVDLVSGGTPCQSVSVAGKRHGMAEDSGTRSSLAFQLPRIGAAIGANWMVWENVAGAFSSNGGRDFSWLLHRMTEYGYKALAWRCMDAQFIRTDKHPRAVPQRRRRVWIVGYKGDDWRIPCEAIFEPMNVLGNEPPKRTVGVGFLKKIEKQTDLNYTPKTDLEEFQDFVNGANPIILDTLVKRGVCESVEARIAELKAEAAKTESNAGGMDLFGGDLFGAPEEKHQGRGLKEKDLELNFPQNADIRSVPQYELFQWAKTVCSEVGYFGDLFKKHEGEASVDDLQPKMLENIGNAGFLCNGLICTMKMPEWNAGVTEEELATMPKELAELYDGDVCGLSDILEENPDAKYKLSWRACYGILRRAVNRGKKLPIELGYALVERIIEQASFIKWTAMYGKDTVKKEGDVSERQIAKTAFDSYVADIVPWDEVKEEEPKKAADEPEEDDANDSSEGEEDGDAGEE